MIVFLTIGVLCTSPCFSNIVMMSLETVKYGGFEDFKKGLCVSGVQKNLYFLMINYLNYKLL